ncbi:MAG: asparagine synthase (glutamine-hydrolyzing) [Robiginitomaculum sp.]|nr:MAG: asparagine synthase (glutamine-hydrolyzing) [Robiginitomaculum sp.]
MCGICGVIWRRARLDSENEGRHIVEKMMTAMRRRGPDGQGHHSAPGVVLGHLRLSIIDIKKGAQPMYAADDKVAIVYNGETYNFHDIRDGLKAKGWQPRTDSDTEAILARYVEDGPSFDQALNGMYSYAIHDQRNGMQAVYLGVDPVGIKPLYLFEDDEVTIFASEMRGIDSGLRALGAERAVDEAGLASYLALGWAPAPSSLMRHVRKLGPGERVKITPGSQNRTQNLPRREIQPAVVPTDFEELVDHIERVLMGVLKRQMISDAPLGFFLSGGIDSSLLVAMATKLGASVKTFSVGFTGVGHGVAAANEADIARSVAKYLGSDHHELQVDADVLRFHLDETLIAMDEPIVDAACLPLLLISKFASEHVKVCLSGDGGDELFAGYPRHWLAPWKRRWQQSPTLAQSLLRNLADFLPRSPGSGVKEILRKGRVVLSLMDEKGYVGGPFSGSGSRFLSQSIDLPKVPPEIYGDGPAMMREDMEGQLAGQMLPKTDRISMWTSLEARVPLLDNDMIALAKALPIEMKLKGRTGKLPLRALLSRHLPDEISQRPKQGFRVPLTSWFRHDFGAMIRERLLDEAHGFGPLLPRSNIEEMIDEHMDGRAEWSSQLWSLLALQSWISRNNLQI